MVRDMKSKLIATMVKAAIDLRLLVGYKLVTLDSLTESNLVTIKQMDALRNDAQHWQDQCSRLSKRNRMLSMEKDRLDKAVQDTSDEKDVLIKELQDTAVKLRDTTSEIEIANSEMLILRASLDEGTELSKQLKEALDRWTS